MERLDYEAMLARLEAVYAAVQRRYAYGEAFRSAWAKSREAACTGAGWTVTEFYAELDRRRA